jgi:hypothetical protein
MALDTYDGLKSTVADFLMRGDLTAAIPGFVTLAEAQMVRRFVTRIRQNMPVPRRLMQRTDASITAGTEFFAVPTGFLGPRVLTLKLADGCTKELDYLPLEAFQREKARGWAAQCRPIYYTVVGEEFQILPVADADYSVELFCLARPLALSASNASNWILADHPDAYLYGALAQSAPYLREDARVTVWQSSFSTAIDDICNADPLPTSKARLETDVPTPRRWIGAGYDIARD